MSDTNLPEKVLLLTKLRTIPLMGIFLALLSSLCNSVELLCIKLIHGLSEFELIVFRSIFPVAVYMIYFLYKRQTIFPSSGERFLLCIRCAIGFSAVICAFFAIRLIPLGDSSAIIYTVPVFVTVFARIFLKEPCSVVNCVAIVITIIGVVLISRPSLLFDSKETVQDGNRLLGSLFAVGCATLAALVYICIRRLQETPAMIVVFYYSLTCVLGGLIVLFVTGDYSTPEGLRNCLLVVGMGTTGILEQLLMTLAFQLEEAAPVSLARSMTMVIAFVFQVTIMKEEIIYTSAIGAVIVLLAIVMVALRKWYEKRPEIFDTLFCCKLDDSRSGKREADIVNECDRNTRV